MRKLGLWEPPEFRRWGSSFSQIVRHGLVVPTGSTGVMVREKAHGRRHNLVYVKTKNA
jgi:hypothetical protein